MAKARRGRHSKSEPLGGEPLRRRTLRPRDTTTLPFAMLNANKRGITLNLKAEKGRALLFEMIQRADVLLENFALHRDGCRWGSAGPCCAN